MKPMEVQTQFSDDIHALGIHVKVWMPEAHELAAQASEDPFTHSSKPLLPERPLSTERPTPMERPVMNQRPALIETHKIKPIQNVISGKYAGLLV